MLFIQPALDGVEVEALAKHRLFEPAFAVQAGITPVAAPDFSGLSGQKVVLLARVSLWSYCIFDLVDSSFSVKNSF